MSDVPGAGKRFYKVAPPLYSILFVCAQRVRICFGLNDSQERIKQHFIRGAERWPVHGKEDECFSFFERMFSRTVQRQFRAPFTKKIYRQ